jgi:N6-L-threonylcarbamoyladenine synthase
VELGHPIATLSGGVSSNVRLVERAKESLSAKGIELRVAKPALRTDNALMIAYVGSLLVAHGYQVTEAQDIAPNFQPDTFPY